MQVKVSDLLKHFNHEPESFKDLLQLIQGSPEQSIEKVLPPDHADAKTLSFCSEASHYEAALRTKPAVLIVLQKTWDAHKENVLAQSPQATILLTRNLPLAMAHTLSYFDEKALRFPAGQQKNCSISPSAQVSPLARLGAYCVIGDDCIIAEHVFVGPHCIIERGSKIGEGTKLHGHVFVGAGTQIGQNCEIHSHTTLGSDGFGYATDSKFKNHKIPQLGRVVIEDHVEIGANCSIDRATLTETRIKSGTKIDNLCHIAHNCEIGSDSLIAAGFMTAGSTKIGARFMTGGNSVVSSHLEITDGVMLAGRSTVTNDISEPGAYGGYPLQPLKEALKTISSLSALPELRKQMNKVLKHLGLNQP